MPSLEKQEGRGRPQYKIEIGTPEVGYRYVSPHQVRDALITFGLDTDRQWVHAAYLSEDNSTIVGVLRIDRASCDGHLIDNPVFQGTLGAEALEQTWALKGVLTGEIGSEQTGRVAGLEKVQFRRSLIPDVDVNIAVVDIDSTTAYGQILSGRTVVTDAVFRGIVITKEEARKAAEKAKASQEKPIFPFQTEGKQGRLL